MNRSSLVLLVSISSACTSGAWQLDDDLRDRPTPTARTQIDACEGAPEVPFPATICVCDEFTMLGNFEAYGFDEGAAVTVGVNERAMFMSNATIEGTLHAHRGLDAGGNVEIGGDLVSSASVTWLGNLEIGGDANVGGDFDGFGNLEIGGDLRLGGADRTVGNVEVGGHGPYVAPAEPPCPCDPSTFFDVSAAVSAAATDPEIASLSSELEGNATLGLATGSYYARDAHWLGNIELTIDGHVDLFIDDSISTLGNGEIELSEGSTLDLYIAGSLRTVGNTWVGGGVPGAVRIYVGGDDAMLLSVGNTEFVASIYAPTAEVMYVGNAEIFGAIFARALTVSGNFEIAHPGLLDAPQPHRCPPPEPGGDEGQDTSTGGTSTGGDDPERSSDSSGDDGTTGDDEPGTTGGDSCPEVEHDCYEVEDKFVCLDTPGCKWKHGLGYCTWQTCGGLDSTMCGLDPSCEWSECLSACYPR